MEEKQTKVGKKRSELTDTDSISRKFLEKCTLLNFALLPPPLSLHQRAFSEPLWEAPASLAGGTAKKTLLLRLLLKKGPDSRLCLVVAVALHI